MGICSKRSKKIDFWCPESYHSWFKITARPYPAVSRSTIPIPGSANASSVQLLFLDLVTQRYRRIRGADSLGIKLPRWCLRRLYAGKKRLARPDANDGRYSLYFVIEKAPFERPVQSMVDFGSRYWVVGPRYRKVVD